ncbi:MAG TPA: heavy metal translocating P-type ATPase [Chitinophagaceae bacterium]|nr:heavy metal translocating P-type ATPase [Chitinophagaceae bacterium]
MHQHTKTTVNTCCTPVEKKLWGFKKDVLFAIVSGIFLLLGYLTEKLLKTPFSFVLIIYGISYLFGSYYTIINSYQDLKEKKFDIDFLMLVAAIGAASLGNFAEGGLLLFLFSLGHALENYAMDKASKSIASLSELAPQNALLKVGDSFKEVKISSLKINDIILVKPNSKIAADGVIIKGQSAINQAPITGESIPVDKYSISSSKNSQEFNTIPDVHKVYTGTINGNAVIEVKVLRLAEDSTLNRLIALVKEGEEKQSPAQRFADKFAKYFVPSVLILVILLLFAFLIIDEPFKDSFYRAMAVLVAASPCALAISTPSAVLAGVARAARGGVLLKGGLPLYEMSKINAIAFDKTGTLTKGNPSLTHVIPYNNIKKEDLLKAAIAIEKLSDHPLSIAIVRDGLKQLEKNSIIPEAKNIKSLTARGLQAELEGSLIYIGNRRLMLEVTQTKLPEDLEKSMQTLEKEGHTAMLVYHANKYLGIIAVQDIARPEAKESIEQLKKELKIKKIVMLSGDNQLVANAIGKELHLDEAHGNLLPEDKVKKIKEIKKHYRVAMVGDGVNDAPAMINSNIGISMGAAGNAVALETADAALLGDSIGKLPFAFKLARGSESIVKQNLFISIGVVVLLIPLAISGLSIGWAVVLHEGSTLLVILNALRILRFK